MPLANLPQLSHSLLSCAAVLCRLDIKICDSSCSDLEMIVALQLLADVKQQIVPPDLEGLQIFPLGAKFHLADTSYPDEPLPTMAGSGTLFTRTVSLSCGGLHANCSVHALQRSKSPGRGILHPSAADQYMGVRMVAILPAADTSWPTAVLGGQHTSIAAACGQM